MATVGFKGLKLVLSI